MAIFDRSWYGRVMVERLRAFAPRPNGNPAYDEINEFEKELANWGALSSNSGCRSTDEQLRRFEDRQNTPDKQWKITDEDWRNRAKWDAYEQAVDDAAKDVDAPRAVAYHRLAG